ncbi:MAG: HTH domain-containing protein [Lachnospiraceae bacterium]|nr:HTH domain-containing protein [Lachnospiraceae bacterium]
MINRLLGIIYIIMNKGTVTAKELAERFEVSVRTIYRDVDTLCMAGIPIYARKGKNGGISLTEQFVLNKLLITEKEQQEILAALLSVQETGAQEAQNTLQKLGEFFKTEPIDWLEIDLSDWSGTRQQLYEDIKRAILNH